MRSPPRPLLAAIGAASAFLVLGAWNIGRSYNFDEAVTVGNFVERDGFLDAVTEQIVFNNQPALTASNWLVYHLGGTSEAWQRLPALLAGTACVGLCMGHVARRRGAVWAAAATFVACPLLLELSRQARGYSMFALFAAASTLVLVEPPPHGGRRWLRYAALVCLGLLSHLHFVVVLGGHAALVHRRSGKLAPWSRATMFGGAVASIVYLPMIPEFRDASASRPSRFQADFPVDAAVELFGTSAAAAMGVVLLVTVAIRSALASRFGAGAGLTLVAVWLGLRPPDLYPRFLVWIVPLLALALGLTKLPRKATTAMVLVTALLAAPTTVDMLRDEPTIRAVSADVLGLEAAGHEVCALGHVWQPLQAYTDTPPEAIADRCDVYVASPIDIVELDIGERVARRLRSSDTFCVIGTRSVVDDLSTTDRCRTG